MAKNKIQVLRDTYLLFVRKTPVLADAPLQKILFLCEGKIQNIAAVPLENSPEASLE
jgi:hypothetical protein